ncbi:MAG: hypothetical protein IKP53_02235 [Candidatus Methanomethylophilaceae archaeon]|nr:hypothetical protein [Candidatus Methanomethylophilaceae archaeon]
MAAEEDPTSIRIEDIMEPGAVVASVGRREDALLCALSFCQAMVEGRIEGPMVGARVVTNVRFVRMGKGGRRDIRAPPGVIVAPTVVEAFHDAAEILADRDVGDSLIVILLDAPESVRGLEITEEIVEFLRRFGATLWLVVPEGFEGAITHTMRLDRGRTGKDHAAVGPGPTARLREESSGRERLLTIPDASWAKPPGSLAPGEWSMDPLLSGPPCGQLRHEETGLDAVQAAASTVGGKGRAVEGSDAEATVRAYRDEVVWRMYSSGFTHKQIGAAFGVTDRTSKNWVARLKADRGATG